MRQDETSWVGMVHHENHTVYGLVRSYACRPRSFSLSLSLSLTSTSFVFFRLRRPFSTFLPQGHMRFVGELYKVELLKEKHVYVVSTASIKSANCPCSAVLQQGTGGCTIPFSLKDVSSAKVEEILRGKIRRAGEIYIVLWIRVCNMWVGTLFVCAFLLSWQLVTLCSRNRSVELLCS